MMDSAPLLEVSGVSKSYDGGETGAVPVLQDIRLTLGTSESAAIVGPSGSGKSTLLNLIGTLDRPDSGQITLGGREITRLDEGELALVRSREIGFVFQQHHLLPFCTVLENVLVPTLAGGPEKRSEPSEDRARHLLERVGLSGRLTHRPGQLSGGERQRVAVVRALINEPRLLLADEPTGALDEAAAENLATLLTDLQREQGIALLVITHSLPLAGRMSKVYELHGQTLRLRSETIAVGKRMA